MTRVSSSLSWAPYLLLGGLSSLGCDGDETPPVTAQVSGVPDGDMREHKDDSPVDDGAESVNNALPDELAKNECDEPINASTVAPLPQLFAAPVDRRATGRIEVYWSFCNAGPDGTTTGEYEVNVQLFASAAPSFEWVAVDGTKQTFDTVMPAIGQCDCVVQSIAINGSSSPGLFNQENWTSAEADYQPIEVSLPIADPDDPTNIDSTSYEYQVWVSRNGEPVDGLERLGFQLQSGESDYVTCSSDGECLNKCCEAGMNICNRDALECGGGA